MPRAHVNGVELNYEVSGNSGPPLVLVHGSWVQANSWEPARSALARTFRVVSYNRRGHGHPDGSPRGCTIEDDVADLAGLISVLNLSPVHLAGTSYGASVSLRFAAAHPAHLVSLNIHEPPLGGLIRDDPEAATLDLFFLNTLTEVRAHLERGQHMDGARAFVDNFFPGLWSILPEQLRSEFAAAGPTFLDEIRDPHSWVADYGLENVRTPTLLTAGSATHPFFMPVLQRVARGLPNVTRFTFEGANHVPHQSHPQDFVAKATEFALSVG